MVAALPPTSPGGHVQKSEHPTGTHTPSLIGGLLPMTWTAISTL